MPLGLRIFFECKNCKSKHKKGCPVCEAQIERGNEFDAPYCRKVEYFIGHRFSDPDEKDEKKKDRSIEKEFQWFVKELVADPKKDAERLVKGCQVIFGDTVFFNDDEKNTQYIITSDKEGCMSYDLRIKSGWTVFNIKEHLEKLREERRYDGERFGLQKRATIALSQKDSNKDEKGDSINNAKSGSGLLNRSMGRKTGSMKRSDGASGGLSNEDVRAKGDFDCAVVRFKKKDFEGERGIGSLQEVRAENDYEDFHSTNHSQFN